MSPAAKRTLLGVGICGGAIAAALAIAHAMVGREFVIQHWAPLAGAALVVVALGTVAWRLVDGAVRGAVLAVRRPRALGQSGAAMAEFVIVVIPFMLMLTALMQLSLASMARVLVSYSAFCAARAAAVFVPADRDSESANSIGGSSNKREDFAKSKKVSLMRNAAAYPLIPVSPSVDVLVTDIVNNMVPYLEGRLLDGLTDTLPTGDVGDKLTGIINGTLGGPLEKFKDQIMGSLLGALGGAGKFKGFTVDRALDVGFGAGTDGAGGAILRSLRKLIYARMGTVVTLHDANGNFKTHFDWNEPIRARVTHLFYCQIPLANRFAGKAFYNLNDNVVADVGTGPMGGFTDIGIPGYFLPITAEHVMINQGKP